MERISIMITPEKKSRAIILFVALFSVVLHLIFVGNLEYHRDELLYFSLGLHPDFGYATVPPMIGWIAMMVQEIFGFSLFAVRIVPAVVGGIMVLIVADMAKELGGGNYARILAGTGIAISVFGLRTFFLFQPVHLDLLFWTLSFYLIIKYINSEADKYLLWFGLIAGLSLLNKYLIGLLFLTILLTIPFTRYRNLFRKKMFWYGLCSGFLVFLPNLIWQITHGMPVFHHLSELSRTQLVNVDRIAFLMEQLISPGAASFLTVAGLIYLFANSKAARFRFLGIIVIIVILTLMIMRGKSYYTQGVFPLLISAGAVSFELLFKKWHIRLVFTSLLLLIALLIIPFGIPVYKSDGLINYFNKVESNYGMDVGRTFEDGSKHTLPQDYADMLGWEELTSIASKAWQMIPDKKAALIYCENYGQAGAITVIGKKYRLPEAVCFSESFRYWIPEKFNPDIKSAIYINDELGTDIAQLFNKIDSIGSISDPDAREFRTTVWLCQYPAISFNDFWSERLSQLE